MIDHLARPIAELRPTTVPNGNFLHLITLMLLGDYLSDDLNPRHYQRSLRLDQRNSAATDANSALLIRGMQSRCNTACVQQQQQQPAAALQRPVIIGRHVGRDYIAIGDVLYIADVREPQSARC